MTKRVFPNRLRYGIFGPADAGKTNILAALASHRIPNPRHLSSIWMEGLTNAAADSFGSTVDGDVIPDDIKLAYLEGIDWLSQARSRLTRGEIIDANDNSRLASRFAFQFHGPHIYSQSASKDAGSISFESELLDYSGELLRTVTKVTEKSRSVRDVLRQCDGLIVVAEAPRKGKSEDEIRRHLSEVEAVFAAIANDNKANERFCPVALVINKWDRLDPDWEFNPEECRSKLETFFQSHPLYQSFRDTVRGAAGDDRFLDFLCSAFGKSKIISQQSDRGEVAADVPVVGDRLYSYGLEDCFFWLYATAEKYRVEKLQKQDNCLAMYRPFAFSAIKRQENELDETSSLFRGSNLTRNVINALKVNLQKKRMSTWVACCFTVLLSLVAILQITTAASDFASEAQYSSSIQQPTKIPSIDDIERLQVARDWYIDYAKRSSSRVLSRLVVMSREKAKNISESIGELQASLIPIYEWDMATSLLEKRIQSSGVRGEFEILENDVKERELQINTIGGLFADQMREEINVLRSKLEQRRGDAYASQWKVHVQNASSQMKDIQSLDELDDLQSRVEKVAADAFGNLASNDFQALLKEFREKRRKIVESNSKEKIEGDFVLHMQDARKAGGLNELRNAAMLLVSARQGAHNISGEAKWLGDLEDSFDSQAPEILGDIVSRHVAEHDFGAAKEIFRVLDSPALSQEFASALSPETIEAFLAGREELLDRPMEKFYYEQLIGKRTTDAAREYLDAVEDDYQGHVQKYYAPTVKRSVDAWLDYQAKALQRSTREFQLARIEFNGALYAFGSTSQYISVYIDDAKCKFQSTKAPDAPFLTSVVATFKQSERALDASHRVAEFPFSTSLAQAVKIRVVSTDSRDAADTGWGGEAVKTVRLEDMVDAPVVFQMRKDGASTGLSVSLQLRNQNEEPILRSYAELTGLK